jgi:acyl-CoA thioester hydrolase
MSTIYHRTEVVTRYCESDALGHINSVSYFIYIEQARVEFLLDNEIIPTIDNWPFILVSTHCDYKQQIYVNDSIVIKTFLKEIGRSSFTLGHEIEPQDRDELLAYGESVVVNFDFDKQKSIPVSVEMRNKMEKFLKIMHIDK